MATPLLGLALPTTGSLTGTWGTTVNDSITSLLDSAVAGTTTLSADSDVTLTTTQEAANQAREAILLWTASGTVTRNITAPAQSKTYIVINSSGTQSIVLRGVGPTTGITIAAGEKCVAAWNGSDFVKVSSSTSASGTVTAVTGTSPVVSSGGTTPAISMPAATSSANGYLTSTDWNTFNGKQGALTLTTSGTSGAATLVGTTLNIPQYAGGGGGGTVTSVSGTGTVSGLTLSGTVTSSGSLTLGGAITGTGSGSVVLATSPTITTPVISGNTTVNGLSLGVGPGTYNVQNTVFGKDAFIAATTGVGNTLIGAYTGGAITTRSNNTAVGYASLVSATSDANTAIGALALSNVSPGTGYGPNTAVGYNALGALATYSNCSGLGASTAVTGNNQVQLGDASTTTYVYGTVQNRSDIRDKADIRDTQLGLGFINALRPVDYKWDARDDYKPARPDDITDSVAMAAWAEACNLSNITHDGSKKRSRYHHGLIAQEVKAVLDAQGIDFGGYQDHSIKGGDAVLSIGYDELIAPLIKAIQELTARVKELESK
jgi:hypothetical protein